MTNTKTQQQDLERVKAEVARQCNVKAMTPAQKSQLLNALNIFQSTVEMSDAELCDYVSKTIDNYVALSGDVMYEYIEGYDVAVPTAPIEFNGDQSADVLKEAVGECKIILQIEPTSDRTESMHDVYGNRCQSDQLLVRHFHITMQTGNQVLDMRGCYLETLSTKPSETHEATVLIGEVFGFGSREEEDFANALEGQCTDIIDTTSSERYFEHLLLKEGEKGAVVYPFDIGVRNINGQKDLAISFQLGLLGLSHCFANLNIDRVALTNTHHLYDEPRKQKLSGIVLNSAFKEMMAPLFRAKLIDVLRAINKEGCEPFVFEPAAFVRV